MRGKPSHRAAPKTVSTFSVTSSILNNNFRQRSHEANRGTEAISSALRLELRPGEWVLWDARPHRFESLEKDRARIRDATIGELREVTVAELRALPYLPAVELDARVDLQRTIDPDEWSLAEKREAAVKEALTGEGPTKERMRAIADALAGIPPNRLSWGNLTAQEFLTVIDDVTTWSLTHFEPVFAWSGAEDLTVVEEQEGYGIVGRGRREGRPADHSPNGNRSLREVTQPRVRGAALWAAHALLASCHGGASDRLSGPIPQERQNARIRRSARASQEWLADRQERWPAAYRRQCWIDVRQLQSETAASHVGIDTNC
jgi:hypothetical protein